MSSDLVDFFLMSLVAMLNPTLLAAVTVMLVTPNTKRLMLATLMLFPFAPPVPRVDCPYRSQPIQPIRPLMTRMPSTAATLVPHKGESRSPMPS